MKIILVTCAVLAFVVAWVLACPAGYVDFGGVCASEEKPEIAPPVVPSDEAPPRGGLPAWQADGVKALEPKSLVDDDRKQDDEKTNADMAGKKAAGVPENRKEIR